jgi:type III secretion system chaperone SycN
MAWIDEMLAEFGSELGISGLSWNAHGVIRLEVDADQLLTIESVWRRDQQELLVSIGRRVGHDAGHRAQIALIRAHAARRATISLQLALGASGADTRLIVTTRLPLEGCTSQTLVDAVNRLNRWIDGVMIQEFLNA